MTIVFHRYGSRKCIKKVFAKYLAHIFLLASFPGYERAKIDNCSAGYFGMIFFIL